MATYLSDRIKAVLTPAEVIQGYGYKINRAGFIQCPFHQGDNHGSLKVYPMKWHCFGCGRGGSVIDFAQELFGLSNIEAMERLNTDFGLRLTSVPETKAERSERVREAERAQRELETYRAEYDRHCREHRRLWLAKQYKAPVSPGDPIDDEYAEACKGLDALDDWFQVHPWR